MTDKTIQNLVGGAIAVMFGFVAFKIIQVQFGKMQAGNGGSVLAEAGEPVANANGQACKAQGTPATYTEGSLPMRRNRSFF